MMSMQVQPKDFSTSHMPNTYWGLPQSTVVRNGRIEIYLANQRLSSKQFLDGFLPWLSDNLSDKVHEARSGSVGSKYISCSLDISGNSELSSEPRVLKALLQLLSKHRVAPTILKLYRMNLDDKHVTVLCDYMNSDMPKECPISELHLSHNQLTCDGAWRLMEVAFECGHYPPKQENAGSLWLRVEKNFPVESEAFLLRKAATIGLAIGTKEHPLDQCTVTMPHFFVSESGKGKSESGKGKGENGKGKCESGKGKSESSKGKGENGKGKCENGKGKAKGKGKGRKNGSQWNEWADAYPNYEPRNDTRQYCVSGHPSSKSGQHSAKSVPSGQSLTKNVPPLVKGGQPLVSAGIPSVSGQPIFGQVLVKSAPSISGQSSVCVPVKGGHPVQNMAKVTGKPPSAYSELSGLPSHSTKQSTTHPSPESASAKSWPVGRPEGSQIKSVHLSPKTGPVGRPEGSQIKSVHPSPKTGPVGRPEGSQIKSVHPSPKSGPVGRPEGSQIKSVHPSPKTGPVGRPEGSQIKSVHPSAGSTTPAQLAYNYVQASTASVVFERNEPEIKAPPAKAIPSMKARSVAIPSTKASSSMSPAKSVPSPPAPPASPESPAIPTSKAKSGIKYSDHARARDRKAPISRGKDVDLRVSAEKRPDPNPERASNDIDLRSTRNMLPAPSVKASSDRETKRAGDSVNPEAKRVDRPLKRALSDVASPKSRARLPLQKKRAVSDVVSPKNPPQSRSAMLHERLRIAKTRHLTKANVVVVEDDGDGITMVDNASMASQTIEIEDEGSEISQRTVSVCSLKEEKFCGHELEEAAWYDNLEPSETKNVMCEPKIDEAAEMPSFYARKKSASKTRQSGTVPTSAPSKESTAETNEIAELETYYASLLNSPEKEKASAQQHESARILSTNSLLEAHYGGTAVARPVDGDLQVVAGAPVLASADVVSGIPSLAGSESAPVLVSGILVERTEDILEAHYAQIPSTATRAPPSSSVTSKSESFHLELLGLL